MTLDYESKQLQQKQQVKVNKVPQQVGGRARKRIQLLSVGTSRAVNWTPTELLFAPLQAQRVLLPAVCIAENVRCWLRVRRMQTCTQTDL